MSIRLLLPAFLLGALISLSLFWLMQFMITNNQQAFKETDNLQMVEFVRLKRETTLDKKQRSLPDEPPPEDRPPPPKMPLQQVQQVTTQTPDFDMPNLDIPLQSARFEGSLLNGLKAGAGAIKGNGIKLSNDIIPLVRVKPMYPMRAASRRIQGWVKVEFIITETGAVRDPQVVDAKPSRIFDRAATKAILKWKFKPKIIDGRAVQQRATQTLEFKLNK